MSALVHSELYSIPVANYLSTYVSDQSLGMSILVHCELYTIPVANYLSTYVSDQSLGVSILVHCELYASAFISSILILVDFKTPVKVRAILNTM